MAQTDTLERTAIVIYALLRELHAVVADPRSPDDVTLGIILGTAMFCDDKVGPFRTRHLMQQAPDIVLKTDAHVTDAEALRAASVLKAFGCHLQALASRPSPAIPSQP